MISRVPSSVETANCSLTSFPFSPSNKKFRCQYVARQISVKFKYSLWVTDAEKQAMKNVLLNCPNEPSVGI